jgi:hypothetical protein
MIGFETIGNATLTVFDNIPVLTTDPWIIGKPYFGSWDHAYTIPNEQIDNIKKSKYVWLSHGHPDHIDESSFIHLKDSILLIPDHFGDRIYNHFSKNYKCIKLKSNEWFQISKNVKIKSFADWNQDGALLVDILGKDIICNQNDGSLLGWSKTISNTVKSYKNKFILKLLNWGDADMINLYDECGKFILPSAAKQMPIGEAYTRTMQNNGYNYAIPFSSMHQYVREDSFHMNKYCTPLDKFSDGFINTYGELLPAFIRWDSTKEDYKKINCSKKATYPIPINEFGDNNTDELSLEDKENLKNYFNSFESLPKHFGSLIFTVGNKDFEIGLSTKKTSIRFEAPRNSLMKSIKYKIFDDMLIGNFMKTTLIGTKSLYPHFAPYVAKYGDNGFSKTNNELKEYFDYYKLNSADYWRDMLKFKTESTVRTLIGSNRDIHNFARKIKQKYF